MLNQLQSLTESVGGNNALIDQWLQARKQLLVSYYHLVGIKPNKDKHTPLDEQALDNFCHKLVDYLSACHFHVYEHMLQDAATLSDQMLVQVNRLAVALQDNTQSIMDFYDTSLATAIDHENYLEFQQALSRVGENLAERFTQEDQLILITSGHPTF